MRSGDVVRFTRFPALKVFGHDPKWEYGLLIEYKKWEKIARILYNGEVISIAACDVQLHKRGNTLMRLHLNKFAKRQTPKSRFSHFEGSEKDLIDLVSAHMQYSTAGYREGVLLVSVPPDGFYSSIVELKEGDILFGRYEARTAGETPRKWVSTTKREKIPAKSVEVVVYTSEVLHEADDNELPPDRGNYEIISINAAPSEIPTPLAPGTLMCNHFGADGGTDTQMTDREFVDALRVSFEYWQNKVLCG